MTIIFKILTLKQDKPWEELDGTYRKSYAIQILCSFVYIVKINSMVNLVIIYCSIIKRLVM